MSLFINQDQEVLESIKEWKTPEVAETTKEEEKEVEVEKPEIETKETNEASSEESEKPKTENEEQPEKKETDTPAPYAPDPELLAEFGQEGVEFKTQEDFNKNILAQTKQLKEATQPILEVGQKLQEYGEKYPEFLALFKGIGEGKDFMTAAIEAGIHEMFPADGDYDHEAYKKKVAERVEEAKKQKDEQSIVHKNISESIKNIDSFRKEHKLGDDYANYINELTNDFSQGHLKTSVLDTIRKGLVYDKVTSDYEVKVKKAREDGIVEGKNAKYEEKKVKKATDVEIIDVTQRGGKEPETVSEKDKRLREKAIQMNGNF